MRRKSLAAPKSAPTPFDKTREPATQWNPLAKRVWLQTALSRWAPRGSPALPDNKQRVGKDAQEQQTKS